MTLPTRATSGRNGQLLCERRNLLRLPNSAATPSPSQAGVGTLPEGGAETLQPLLSLALDFVTASLGTHDWTCGEQV